MPDAFYLPTDDPERHLSTPATEGPWSSGLQHGGPPCALLTRAVERTPSSLDGPAQVSRITVDFLGAVPVDEVTVRAAVARPGRSVELVEAELHAAGRVVLRARVWRIRRTPVELPAEVFGTAVPPPPRPAEPSRFTEPRWQVGYLRAIDWRFVEGHFERPGPASAWARQRIPLVAGEEPSPLQRVALLADSGNGLSRLLEMERWWFINTELTVHLHRQPSDDWLHVSAATTLDPQGSGLAETVLSDAAGPLGRGAQALMVGRRSG
ncbi:thioesterase family protein [Micromonospora sp. WMMD1102]|uniref:thioesterase family protein n=1 Tax=Micromonospora sp. WMMD1102 TaxID=3016105 RepID=UPI00241509E0|nr:thioesterase family protein [Micromonospora sp. WMMD1102]MDG4788530.1 thioesterase family protein [Micromonospora sp. WMMD1102]